MACKRVRGREEVCQVKLVLASAGAKTRHQLSEEEQHEGRADTHRRRFEYL